MQFINMAGLSRTVLVFFGQHTHPVSFSAGATPEETRKILLESMMTTVSDRLLSSKRLILQIRDEDLG